MRNEQDLYQGRHLEQALAEDPRISELGVSVTVTSGRAVLHGEVASAERRATVVSKVAALAPDLGVVDDLVVTEQLLSEGPGSPEVLR